MTIDLTDVRATIVPKSDQTNADDLVAGPLDIVVTSVTSGSTPEQPLSLHYAGADGRPYKPCKTMRKLLVFAWGADATQWAGRGLRIYCDPAVKFGGQEVGGIRISHMTHIDKTIRASLAATKGKKTLYVVEPMPQPAAAALPSIEDAATVEDLKAAFQAAWKSARGNAELQAQHKARYDARLAQLTTAGGAA